MTKNLLIVALVKNINFLFFNVCVEALEKDRKINLILIFSAKLSEAFGKRMKGRACVILF